MFLNPGMHLSARRNREAGRGMIKEREKKNWEWSDRRRVGRVEQRRRSVF